MTNDSFYTTYIFSCGDDFKALGGGDKVQDRDPQTAVRPEPVGS